MSPVVWVIIGVVVLFVLLRVKAMSRSPEALVAIRRALDKGALLVDVRTPGEFNGHHLPGAVNVPLAEIGAGRLGRLGAKNRALVLYCRSGSRSAMAARTLQQAGYEQVLDLGGLHNFDRLPGTTPPG